MDREFTAVKISETVYWVGAIDWSIIDFHGYSTKRGTTYNAFLILADKITLIDTVKEPFKGQMLSRIESVIPVKTIDYIVSNHSEMDHTGALPDIINIVSPEKIFASSMGEKTLREHFELNMDI
ncbi:MAG: FprA family A-type flavoprotein, partial [Deltaproteobacteria bacterium]|nr:FprA family A-type flavoprotein [Deltaproteobacteria bacterium]